jgi:hypothetical protein
MIGIEGAEAAARPACGEMAGIGFVCRVHASMTGELQTG